jgi:hypothetical protein
VAASKSSYQIKYFNIQQEGAEQEWSSLYLKLYKDQIYSHSLIEYLSPLQTFKLNKSNPMKIFVIWFYCLLDWRYWALNNQEISNHTGWYSAGPAGPLNAYLTLPLIYVTAFLHSYSLRKV